MSYEVLVSPDALDNISSIFDYISNTINNPSAATRITDKILSDIDLLKESPELGPSIESRIGLPTFLRYLVVENYVVIYAIDEKTIQIKRVFNARMDYLKILLD